MSDENPRGLDDHMIIWSQVSKTPESATKKVEYGSRKFTTIDAYWQMEKATQIFGPIGWGWGWDEPTFKLEKPQENVIKSWYFHTVIRFWYIPPWDRSHDRIYIPIHVQKAAVDKYEKFDDETYKKMVTDGITKALSYMGWSADVFQGKFDDNRYVAEMRKEEAEQARQARERDREEARQYQEPPDRQGPQQPAQRQPEPEETPPAENPEPKDEAHPYAGVREDLDQYLEIDPEDNNMTVQAIIVGLNTMGLVMGDGDMAALEYLKVKHKWYRPKDCKRPYLVNLYRKHKARCQAYLALKDDEDKMERFSQMAEGSDGGSSFWIDLDDLKALAYGEESSS